MRLGTPSGLSTMSAWVPSSRNGMSSIGTILDTTPLLPWRPAILSPGWILRFTATKTLTIFITPGGNSSPRCSFSTLSRKRCSKPFFDSSYCLRMASISAISLSFGEANSHHCERALVFVDAMAIENPHFDDGALDARRHPQRGIANIGGLLAEDGAKEFLLGRHRAFTLWRYLADQDVARVNFGADVHDAGLIEILQRLFGDVRDIAGDFLGAELGVPGHHLELLDMNRGEYVVLDDPLGEQNRVLEVVAVPRHEGDED